MAGKTYLGDGVYVEDEMGMIKLTTEDGLSTTNTIYLESGVWRGLNRWVESRRNTEDTPEENTET